MQRALNESAKWEKIRQRFPRKRFHYGFNEIMALAQEHIGVLVVQRRSLWW